MKTCPQCKYGMRPEWEKCPECGMKLGSKTPTPRSDQWLRGYDDTQTVLDAYSLMQDMEMEIERLKSDCNRWSDAETLHPIMHCQNCGELRMMNHLCTITPPQPS